MGSRGGAIAATIGLALLGGWAGGAAAGALGFAGTAAQIMVGLGYMGGSFLGNMLFAEDSDVESQDVGGYPIQTARYGTPNCVDYGKNRVAGNIIWLGDSTTYDIEVSSGGKGGSDEVNQTGYRRSFAILLCEGERTVSRLWKNDKEITSRLSYSYALAEYGTDKEDAKASTSRAEITVFSGDGNVGLSYLIGEDFSKYSHDCIVFFQNFDLGTSDSLPNFTFEIEQVAGFDVGLVWSWISTLETGEE